jgi:hypothetical protein
MGGDASGGSVEEGGHGLINIGSGQSSALPLKQLPDLD